MSSSYSMTELSLKAKSWAENSAEATKGLGFHQHKTTARASFEEKQPR